VAVGVILVEEEPDLIPGETHPPVTRHWQTWSYKVVRVPMTLWWGDWIYNLVMIATDCMGRLICTTTIWSWPRQSPQY